MKKLTYILLTLLVLSACTDRQEYAAMRHGLDSINERNRNDEAFSVSDVQPYLEFFNRHGEPNDQMLANYMMGSAYRDEGNAPMALKFFRFATELADTTADNCDYRILSRVYGQIAHLFHIQRSPNLELAAQHKAIQYAWIAKDTVSAIIFTENLAKPYHMLNQMDSALYFSQKAASLFKAIGRTELAVRTLGLDIDIYLRQQNYNLAKEAIEEYENKSLFFDEHGNIVEGKESFYNFKGIYFEGVGQRDSAEYYYRKLLFYSHNLNSKEAAYKGLLSIYQKSKNGDSIAKYSNLYCQANDSASFAHSADEITRMQALYNYDESERRAVQEEKKAERYRKLFFVIVSLLILCTYLTYRIIKRQKRLRKQELIKANTAYTTLLTKYSEVQKDLKTAQQGLNNYRIIKEKEIESLQHELSSYLEEAELQKKWDLEQAMLHNAIVIHFHKLSSRAQKASAVEWQDFNRFALDSLPSFIKAICAESANLTDKELKVCMLTRLHFAPTEVAALLDLTKQRISNIRANANRKLFNDGSAISFDANIHRL
jgi:hypothetical protein